MGNSVTSSHSSSNIQQAIQTDLQAVSVTTTNIHHNLPQDLLIEHALAKKEGTLSKRGSLTVTTGKYTGRSPHDRFFVKDAATHDLEWNAINKPFSQKNFDKLHQDTAAYLSEREIYISERTAGADETYALNVRFVSEYAYHDLFVRHMFRPYVENNHIDFTVLCAPDFKANPATDGTNSECFIVINFTKKLVLIGGTKYAGEIKKAIFTIMNFLLPKRDVLPMHCGANTDSKDNTALFFGLSGTGKTTLSSDQGRQLIGDDEHGWSATGVFNIENGCYAKCIGLREEREPDIWNAITHGTVVENVVMDEHGEYNFDDNSITENSRCAYPMHHIENSRDDGMGGHPNTVIFLTADAHGVLPPVAKLEGKQILYHFLTGYTSKIAGTERGVLKPRATFSSFFGEPFMPCKPDVYLELLDRRIAEHKAQVFLINTGWTGGPYGEGERIKLKYSRAMVTAAVNGELDDVEYEHDEQFNLLLPKHCPGVPDAVLRPRSLWKDTNRYDDEARKLIGLFMKNNKKHTHVAKEILDAGPKLT